MSEQEITCQKCGYINRIGAKFCRGCGSALQYPPPAVYPPAPPPPVYTPAPPPQPAYYAPPPAPPARKKVKSESILVTFLAWAFAGLFVLLVCFTLPFYLSMQTLLEPEIYTQALVDQDFYNRFPDLFVEQMDYSKPAELRLEGISCVNVQDFTRSDWELIAEKFLPPNYLQGQTESLMGQFFDFMKADDGTLALQISASQFKDLLNSDEGFAFYQSIIETKPVCSLTDVMSIGAWVINPQSSCLNICRPFIDINQNIWDILISFAGAIPTEYSLENFINLQPLEDLRPLYRLATTVQKALPLLLIVAAFCLLLTLISRKARSIQGILLFWGLPLAIAGLLCIIIAILMPVAGGWMITEMSRAADLYAGVEELLVDITRQITTTLRNDIALPAAALLVIGGLMSAAGIGWGIVRRLVKA